jgi:allophanate hydrolase
MLPETLLISTLLAGYRERRFSPLEVLDEVLARSGAASDRRVWISLLSRERVLGFAAALGDGDPASLPLYGVPFAIKDNIDLENAPTTAGCPDYAYTPTSSAFVVRKLIAAGAVPIGKTNLDQFATGLVGTRSPYGATFNSFDPAYVSGGSSSGSAVAVATGLVSFALGTDTAGSGRVPAAFNNIVGMKPTCGALSKSGVVPACRSLDCVSIFALTADDVGRVLDVAAGFDPEDCYSRELVSSGSATIASTNGSGSVPPAAAATERLAREPLPAGDSLAGRSVSAGATLTSGGGVRSWRAGEPFLFGVPRPGQLEFFGDEAYARLFKESVRRLEALGGRCAEIDFGPFLAAARLLYEGPWVAERYCAVGEFLERRPQSVHPVTRQIISTGRDATAVDAFRSQYRLLELRRTTERTWREIDFLVTPTAGTIYRIDAVEADPIRLNSNLGYYTNFVNLLDLSAVAVPAGFRGDGLPFGITFTARAGADAHLLSLANMFQRAKPTTLGALSVAFPSAMPNSAVFEARGAAAGGAGTAAGESSTTAGAGGTTTSSKIAAAASLGGAPQAFALDSGERIAVAVCGAHMEGLPLNHQLTSRGAVLLSRTRTASAYRFYALPGGPPHRPGLVRVSSGGASIEVEVWSVPAAHFGSFVAGIPAPLGIGKVELETGEQVAGFMCESYATTNASDITALGGWRNYIR